MCSVLVLFILKTFHRNAEWKDNETLSKAGLKVNPTNAKIYMTMGNALAKKVRHYFDWGIFDRWTLENSLHLHETVLNDLKLSLKFQFKVLSPAKWQTPGLQKADVHIFRGQITNGVK